MAVKKMISILIMILLIFTVISTSAFKSMVIPGSFITSVTLGVLIILDFLSFLVGKISIRNLILFGIMIIVAIVVTYESKSTKVLIIVMYIFACRFFTIEESIRIFIIAKSITLVLTFILYILGFLNDFNNSVYGKHSFGFGLPNTLGATIFILEVCLFLRFFMQKKIHKLAKSIIIVMQLPLFFLVYLSGSRGSEIGIIMTVIMVIFVLLSKYNGFLIRLFSYLNVISIPLISIYISKIFLNLSTGGYMGKINTVLSDRLRLSAMIFEQYGFKIFGQKINYNFTLSELYHYSFLDNAYMELLIRYGVVSLLFVVAYHYLLLKKGFSKKKLWLPIMIVVISFYGFVEQGYSQFWVNPAFTMAGFLFSDSPYLKGKSDSLKLS